MPLRWICRFSPLNSRFVKFEKSRETLCSHTQSVLSLCHQSKCYEQKTTTFQAAASCITNTLEICQPWIETRRKTNRRPSVRKPGFKVTKLMLLVETRSPVLTRFFPLTCFLYIKAVSACKMCMFCLLCILLYHQTNSLEAGSVACTS